ncbi:MAG: diacylglycerol kinase family protein [Myxococcota bacterium]|nr:diacylglycerol kinase family protein [Myxococcota bacterium]
MPAPTLIIVNPKAGKKPPRIPRLEARLKDILGEVELARTAGPRDAIRIAREAVRSGVERLVVGGGDGTLSEVVTGILDSGLGGEVEIGFLPLGSGCDLARSVGLPRSIPQALELLAQGERRKLDAGRVRFVGRDGAPGSFCFINETSFGLSGLTVDWMNRFGRRLGPRLGFGVAAAQAVLRGQTPDVAITVDGREVHRGPTSMVVVANGCFFGGGMKIAPDARPDDGEFDVVIVSPLSRPRFLANFPSLYKGTHLSHPAVRVFKGKQIEARPQDGSRAPLDTDGEALGVLPLSVELLPQAITFFGFPAEDGSDGS